MFNIYIHIIYLCINNNMSSSVFHILKTRVAKTNICVLLIDGTCDDTSSFYITQLHYEKRGLSLTKLESMQQNLT